MTPDRTARPTSGRAAARIEATDDAGRLARLHGEAFAAPWPASAFADLLPLPGTCALVATDRDGADAGLVLARLAGEDCEIVTVGVRPARRGRGLGEALLDRAAAWSVAHGATRQVLEVDEANRAARALYGRLGFRQVGRRPAYYDGSANDALILARDLTRAG